jgi:hypothetical protein
MRGVAPHTPQDIFSQKKRLSTGRQGSSRNGRATECLVDIVIIEGKVNLVAAQGLNVLLGKAFKSRGF